MNPFDFDGYWREEQLLEAEAYRWFYDLYYDPEEEAAAGITRQYRWLPQDPVSPYEVLQAQFGRKLSERTIVEMSDALSKHSINWRARPDEFTANIDPINQKPQSSDKDHPSAKLDLIAAIAELERAIATIRAPSPEFGHNMPPEGIFDDPTSKRELDDLLSAVADLKIQANASIPEKDKIASDQKRLLKFAQTVMSWTGERGTKFVDAAMDSGGKALGTAIVLQVTGILPQVFAVVAAAGKFLSALAH